MGHEIYPKGTVQYTGCNFAYLPLSSIRHLHYAGTGSILDNYIMVWHQYWVSMVYTNTSLLPLAYGSK